MVRRNFPHKFSDSDPTLSTTGHIKYGWEDTNYAKDFPSKEVAPSDRPGPIVAPENIICSGRFPAAEAAVNARATPSPHGSWKAEWASTYRSTHAPASSSGAAARTTWNVHVGELGERAGAGWLPVPSKRAVAHAARPASVAASIRQLGTMGQADGQVDQLCSRNHTTTSYTRSFKYRPGPPAQLSETNTEKDTRSSFVLDPDSGCYDTSYANHYEASKSTGEGKGGAGVKAKASVPAGVPTPDRGEASYEDWERKHFPRTVQRSGVQTKGYYVDLKDTVDASTYERSFAPKGGNHAREAYQPATAVPRLIAGNKTRPAFSAATMYSQQFVPGGQGRGMNGDAVTPGAIDLAEPGSSAAVAARRRRIEQRQRLGRRVERAARRAARRAADAGAAPAIVDAAVANAMRAAYEDFDPDACSVASSATWAPPTGPTSAR